MSFRVDPRISEEAAAKWQLALDRIDEQSAQHLRSNLEVVLRHVEAEYLGDISTIMGTMAPYPRHEYVGIDKESPVGYEAVKAVYEAENKKGHRIFEFTGVWVDKAAVVIEGVAYETGTGERFDKEGLGGGQLEPDRRYISEGKLLIVSPIDNNGLIECERVYWESMPQVTGPLIDGHGYLEPAFLDGAWE